MKHKTVLKIGTLAAMLLMLAAGCGNQNIVKCTLSVQEQIIVSYNDKDYIILDEKIDAADVGSWVGYINEHAAGCMFSTVYLDKRDEDMINIAVDNFFYKAIDKEQLSDEQIVFVPEENTEEISDVVNEVQLNPSNATQIIYNEKIYQVSDKTVQRDMLDAYISCIAVYAVIDMETGRLIPKEEYTKIDWTGNESEGSNRVAWVYGNVYSLKNDSDSIGVEINGKYHIANCFD